ncbi:MAG: TetR/AcrR family transcriptional regulator [Bacillota bacterium]|nr:TetR/AcrR family transcriptional regulator [Bacillota bacterium]
MPSSPKIPRERILAKALEMLIDQGYESINIKSLAKALGCSTQPISWQFGGMEGLRRELVQAAMKYADDKLTPDSYRGADSFLQVGKAFIDMAFDEPNLFRFLYLGDQHEIGDRLEKVILPQQSPELIKVICSGKNLKKEEALAFIQTLVIYTYGLTALIATGLLQEDRETAYKMIENAGLGFQPRPIG